MTHPCPLLHRAKISRSLCHALLPLLLTLVLLPAAVPAQVRIPDEALTDEASIQKVLLRGHELESQRRWGEALAHYEDAVRTYPERRDLRQRMTWARLQFDLGRRYEDRGYAAAVASMTERKALEVHDEVLRKIEEHYYKSPDWQQTTERGIDAVNIALTRDCFRDNNGLSASPETVEAFQDEIRRRMDVTVVRSRRQAQEVAANVARLASQRLGVRPASIVMEFTSGAVCGLGPYSCFLTGEQLDDLLSQIGGSFVGLGIELKAHDRSLAIISVIPNSPAYRAGIRGGDRIIEVDGISTADMTTDQAADRLKGPEGSATELKVQDSDGVVRVVRVARRRVEVPSVVDAKIADPTHKIAYMRLATFQKTTSRDVDAALWTLHRQGMNVLIVDVRGNPGGLLPAAIEAADRFVSSGNIVSTRGRDAHEDFDYRAHAVGTWSVPLIVLIDGDTASASEIFAGAIRDHHRGTVIGQRSYGKGSVQGIFSLSTAKVGVRLTTAKFYSPNGVAISNRGVYPDVTVQTAAKPVLDGSDTEPSPSKDLSLESALQYARTRLSSHGQMAYERPQAARPAAEVDHR